ncbi:MAG: hypothetical protein JF615_01300, partial [Asticcacaulis sp.]|nr:hypothetical protein [Asticcacaulis sp.]
GFILLYFVLRALASVTAGRLIHERLKGQPTTFRRVTVEAPWLWLRGLLVYLLLFGVSYLCQYLWLPSAIPVAIVAGFVLPPFMLDRQGLITALRTAWNVARGRWLAALVTASLLTGFGYGAQWLIDWANGHFAGALSFALASVALNIAFALIQLVQSACMLSLYANCRELSRPPGDVAEVFE